MFLGDHFCSYSLGQRFPTTVQEDLSNRRCIALLHTRSIPTLIIIKVTVSTVGGWKHCDTGQLLMLPQSLLTDAIAMIGGEYKSAPALFLSFVTGSLGSFHLAHLQLHSSPLSHSGPRTVIEMYDADGDGQAGEWPACDIILR